MFGRTRRHLFPLIATACIGLAARGEYAVVDLGVLTNTATGTSRSVGGVNAMLQVALTTAADPTAYHAYRWAGGAALDLGTLGGTQSFAAGINDAGQVVGRSTNAGGVTQAFLWTPGGTDGVATNPQMKALYSANVSQASGVNASGQVVGYVRVSSGPVNDFDRAFLYTGGAIVQVPLPDGGFTHSYAYAVNDGGKVVGEVYTKQGRLGQGFVYDGNASTLIGDLGAVSSTPLAINNGGRIVGYSANPDGFDHAFAYANGAMTDLGTLGGTYSYAKAINNLNQIVGGAYVDAEDSVYHAFTTDGGPLIDLNAKLTSKAAGWALDEAAGVNDDGVIVGTGTLSGERHGFLLRPLALGDATADGRVDFEDLVALAQNYNTVGEMDWERGDFTGDDNVDFNDLVALAQNYNSTQWVDPTQFTPEFAAAFAAAVPEPGAVGVVTIAMLLVRRRYRTMP
jgi:probable HAF family extracellular repeat protein